MNATKLEVSPLGQCGAVRGAMRSDVKVELSQCEVVGGEDVDATDDREAMMI